MENKKKYEISLDRVELMDAIHDISFIIQELLIQSPKVNSDEYGALISLSLINNRLSKHLEEIGEEH